MAIMGRRHRLGSLVIIALAFRAAWFFLRDRHPARHAS
jgi:hypothetical protein